MREEIAHADVGPQESVVSADANAERKKLMKEDLTDGNDTHPPIIERHAALQQQQEDGKEWKERSWRERQKIRKEAQEERGSGRE